MFQYFLKVVSTQFNMLDHRLVRSQCLCLFMYLNCGSAIHSIGRISTVPPASSGTSQKEYRKTTRRGRTSRTLRPVSQVRVHTPTAWLHTLTLPSAPGVFLNYDISPILIVHDEVRQSFAHFLTSYVFPVVPVVNEMLTGAAATQDVRDCGRGADGRVTH